MHGKQHSSADAKTEKICDENHAQTFAGSCLRPLLFFVGPSSGETHATHCRNSIVFAGKDRLAEKRI